MSMYYCGETGCKGHHSFAETCSDLKTVRDYPGLLPFIQGINEEETQPYQPVELEPVSRKAHGQSTAAMKVYDNKMKVALTVPAKAKSR